MNQFFLILDRLVPQDKLPFFISHKLPNQYSEIKTVFIRRADTYLTSAIEKFIETIEMNKQLSTEPLMY